MIKAANKMLFIPLICDILPAMACLLQLSNLLRMSLLCLYDSGRQANGDGAPGTVVARRSYGAAHQVD